MLKANDLVVSMSRRGNCHDNTCAESFFARLKRERIRRKIYRSREEGKLMYLILLSCSIILPGVMEIIMTCRPWSMKRTIFWNSVVSKKLGAIQVKA
jgi:transposase InsO family protein